jgi:molybdenum cofactor synthesis domain-containing protein
MSEAAPVTACLVIIGNEILSGRTQDLNLKYLAERLNALGIRLAEARVIPDVADRIVETVNEVRARYDYVFTTGGIGPTHDDITSECIARAFGVPLIRNSEAVALMEAHYEPGMLNEARLRMANTPEGAMLLRNPVSAAPGYRIGNVIVMAGVPKIMQAMFEGIAHDLVGGEPMLSRTVVAHLPEGAVAAALGALQERFPELEIGSYPFFKQGRFGTSLVLRGTEEDPLTAGVAELKVIVRSLGAEPEEET